jgi:glycosyltransferase involved in cell wall biosynthesis
MANQPLTVAWFSYFPVEWLPGVPAEARNVPKQHPASWQRVLLEEFEQCPDLRLHIVVLRKQFARDLTFERNGVTFHLVHTPGGWRAPTLFWLDTILIRRVLRQVQPDVVHAWGTEQGAALVAQRLGLPNIVTVQGLMSWYATITPPTGYDHVTKFLEHQAFKRIPLATTEARFSVKYLRDRYPRLHVEQIEHAPDPVFHRLVRRPQTAPLRFIFVGAFDHRKGGDVLLRSLDTLKDELNFELIVVGKPKQPFFEQLKGSVSPALWQRIVFKENLTHVQVAEQLTTATMMLCPTRGDVSPNAVKEAAAAGLPVVATNVGGIPDYIFSDQNGVLCAPNSAEEFTAAIRAAARHPHFLRGEVDAATLVRVREYLSPKLMARRFLETYRLALATQPRRKL